MRISRKQTASRRFSSVTAALTTASLSILAVAGCSMGEERDAALVARGDSGAQVEELHRYLERYGYLQDKSGNAAAAEETSAARDVFDERLERALVRFQERFKLPADGTLNPETRELMAKPRCSMPDVLSPEEEAKFTAFQRWPSSSLTYSHANFTPDLSSAFVESSVTSAISAWTGATSGLAISKVGSGGDIVLSFAVGDHGDGYPFDGVNGVLAHAFYPPYGGDVHFDDSETWSSSGSGGYHFPTVALHELGHSLGLDHSFVAGAVMEPYYAGPRGLSEDDVLGIQELYAIRSGSPPAAPSFVSASSWFCRGWHDISWPAVSGATSYRLEFSPVSNFAYGGMIYAGSSTSVTIEVGDIWYLRARACNAGGCSGNSGVAQARYHYGECM